MKNTAHNRAMTEHDVDALTAMRGDLLAASKRLHVRAEWPLSGVEADIARDLSDALERVDSARAGLATLT